MKEMTLTHTHRERKKNISNEKYSPNKNLLSMNINFSWIGRVEYNLHEIQYSS